MNKSLFVFERAVLAYGSRNGPVTGALEMQIPEGKITAIVGRNGAGKTTVLRALLGEKVVRSGTVTFGDEKKEVTSLSARAMAEQMAFVPQEAIYPYDLQVKNYLRLAFLPQAGLFGKLPPADCEPIQNILSDFKMTALKDALMGNLSSGERQRLFLARALLQNPKALLLDEPTNHLDPAGVKAFWRLLASAKKQQTLIVSTHDLGFVKAQSDYVVALETGSIVFAGSREAFVDGQVAERLFSGE